MIEGLYLISIIINTSLQLMMTDDSTYGVSSLFLMPIQTKGGLLNSLQTMKYARYVYKMLDKINLA